MGDVVPFLRPGAVPDSQDHRDRLLRLSCEIRESQIGLERAIASGVRPVVSARALSRSHSDMTEIVLASFGTECVMAKSAIILFGQLQYLDTDALATDHKMLATVECMREDLDRVLSRMFLWSTVTHEDYRTIQTIDAYLPKVQVTIRSRILSLYAS